ncbi:MAG: hypothetical protein IPP74_14770 [Alphaproteobacteria bacterium]|nr:hypothetical protein [Alphaproteobacteria bacterium]
MSDKEIAQAFWSGLEFIAAIFECSVGVLFVLLLWSLFVRITAAAWKKGDK